MNFGKVENPGEINFTLPPDNLDTKRVLSTQKHTKKLEVFIGCAKWNKKDLKNFYPKGTKDELAYYSSQFNSIELNATFYNSPTKEQVVIWKQKSAENFKFFPKINQLVSHYRRLDQVKPLVDDFCEAVSLFEEKLGMVFLQMHDKFGIKNYDRVEKFVKEFPSHVPLAMEVRNADWFKEKTDADRYFHLLEENKITNIIVDTAGRRDMLHMRLTTPTAFIRYVGANHESDYQRLDEWVARLKKWKEEGLQELYFFVHQNIELESPLLSAYFIEQLNNELELDIKIPEKVF